MSNQPTHGGKREGSGRKPLAGSAYAHKIAITLTPDDLAYIDAQPGKNRSEKIRAIVESHRAAHPH